MKKEYLIYKLSDEVKNSCKIPREAFGEYGVKRGLRNEDGSGVLVGLTNIGNVIGYERDDNGTLKPSAGKLYYRGYELNDLVEPLLHEKRFGFEDVPSLGEQFDPELHNAVMRESGDEPGKILEVFQKGYRVKDKIIRYAMVKVCAE